MNRASLTRQDIEALAREFDVITSYSIHYTKLYDIVVADVQASARRCAELGGPVLVPPRGDRPTYCVIRDPAGAICALFQPQEE